MEKVLKEEEYKVKFKPSWKCCNCSYNEED